MSTTHALPADTPAHGLRPFDVVRIAVGLLLIIAAGLKAYGLWTVPGAHQVLWAVLVFAESSLGLALLAGLWPHVIRWVAAAAMAGFTVVAVASALRGAADCGCFGPVAVHPWLTAALDAVALAALLLTRPAPEPPAAPSAGRRLAVVLVLSGGLALPASLLLAAQQPGTLDEDGAIEGQGRLVVLEPQTWMDRPLPLIPHIEGGAALAEGAWRVLLYHHDCPDCIERIDALADADDESAPPLALVEVPPRGPLPLEPLPAEWRHLPLDDSRNWVVATPTLIHLEAGVVQSVQPPDHVTEPQQAEAEPQVAPPPAEASETKPQAQPEAGPSEAQNPAPAPQPRLTVDFGYVEPGETYRDQFVIVNQSDEPFHVRRTVIACSCTRLPETPEAIPGRGHLTVPLHFEPPETVGPYAKTITLIPEDLEREPIVLTARARINQPLRVEPEQLDLGELAPGATHRTELVVHNDGPDDLRLLYATASAPNCVAEVPREPVVPAGGSLTVPVRVEVNEGASGGRITLRLHTAAASQSVVRVPVRYRVAGTTE